MHTKYEVSRRLVYDNISLEPVDAKWRRVSCPHDIELEPDSWHVPGCRIMSTPELVALANARGVTILLVEASADGQTTHRLN